MKVMPSATRWNLVSRSLVYSVICLRAEAGLRGLAWDAEPFIGKDRIQNYERIRHCILRQGNKRYDGLTRD